MDVRELAQRTTRLLEGSGNDGVRTALPHEDLLVLEHARPTALHATLYDPVVCLILRGRKETTLGERTVTFGAGEALVVSHDLPVVSQITEASPEAPYLALVLRLDLALLRGLHGEVPARVETSGDGRALEVQAVDRRLVDAFARYLDLAGSGDEARVLGPLVRRELHFRLLVAPHGGMLRQLLHERSHASRIADAIGRIRAGYKGRLVVPELARSLGMSASSFHEHFKAVTATTPLQYQKQLRLLEARRLLTVGGRSVSDAAFEVGYESPTQFSREYARAFGGPPSADLAR